MLEGTPVFKFTQFSGTGAQSTQRWHDPEYSTLGHTCCLSLDHGMWEALLLILSQVSVTLFFLDTLNSSSQVLELRQS